MKLPTFNRWQLTGIITSGLILSASMLPLTTPTLTAAASNRNPQNVNSHAAVTVIGVPNTAAQDTNSAGITPQPPQTAPAPDYRSTASAPRPTQNAKPTRSATPKTKAPASQQKRGTPSTSTSIPTATPQTSNPSSSSSTTSTTAANNTPWTQVYAQDFTTTAGIGNFGNIYGKNLLGYNGFADTSGNGTYTPNQVLSTQNGYLDYYIHASGGKYLTAAPMPQGSTGQTYGRYSMRFRSDTISGYKLAFLLWPDSGTWSDGEIDFPEAELGGAINAYSHDTTGNPSHNAFAWNTGLNTTAWHTITLEWTPDNLTYTIDGVSQTTTNKTAIPTKPMHLVLQAETDLNGIKPATSAAGHIQIDWLTIDKYTG